MKRIQPVGRTTGKAAEAYGIGKLYLVMTTFRQGPDKAGETLSTTSSPPLPRHMQLMETHKSTRVICLNKRKLRVLMLRV